MHKLEEIFNQALKRARQGETTSAIVSSYPQEFQAKLNSLLTVAEILDKLPKRTAPQPLKRKLFLEHQPVHISKIRLFVSSFSFAPLAIVAVVLLITGTAYGSSYALPGSPFFVVKKTYEKIHLTLTTNPEHRAALQIQIATQRLEDAQKVLSQNSNSNSQAQALAELDNQTTVALNNVKGVAASISSTDPGLVKKAEQLTENKNTFLTKVSPETAQQSEAENKTVLNDIKKIVATTSEQSAAKLLPAKIVTETGLISEIKENTIKVGQNEFEIIANQTVITIQDQANPISLSDLRVNDNVKIEAKIEDNKNIAISIVRLPKPIITQIIPIDDLNSSAPPRQEQNFENPQDTFGGFILEPPAQSQ